MLRALIPMLLLAATRAEAQNASTAGALDLYPTYQCVGARLDYTGDANGNATAHLEWRPQGAATWTVGTSMTRITGSRWAASLFWLTPDTPYDVRAVIDDPDGTVSASGSVRTRANFSTAASGRTWWVASSGSDANDGSSGAPYATLQKAIDQAQPGDEVRVRAGLYYQSAATSRAGTPAARIHLVADGPGVVLDGSDPAWLQRTDWRDDGGGVFSQAFTAATRLVCADSSVRLYHQATLADLRAGTGGVTQGWVIEGGRLYVLLEGGVSPNAVPMHIARFNIGLNVVHADWRVSGFHLRYYGTTSNGGAIVLLGADRAMVSDNWIETIGGRYIFVRGGTDDALIEHNVLNEPRIYSWPWASGKGHEEELQCISLRGGRGCVARFNVCRGTFDGIDTTTDGTGDDSGSDTDIDDNDIAFIRDDAIEPEQIAGINTRIWKNHCAEMYDGISIAPNSVGPEYVIYNTFVNFWQRGYKCSLSSTGQTWIMHNTWASTYTTATVHPTGVFSNMHFRNNILTGHGAACVSDDAGESATGNDFDGDLCYSDYAALFRWKNTNYATLAALRTATGFEMGGRSGDPRFISIAGADLRLLSGSPAIDGAIRLPGINDAFVGAAPDMGAMEFTNGADATRPAPITDLH